MRLTFVIPTRREVTLSPLYTKMCARIKAEAHKFTQLRVPMATSQKPVGHLKFA